MKAVIACLLVLSAFALAEESFLLKCPNNNRKIETAPNWTDMEDPCIQAMRKQIKRELGAAMKYLAMGAHFSRDTVNRPGFAKKFFEAASEERQHAIKLIEYLLTRGELISDVTKLVEKYISVDKTVWNSGAEALRDALQLEASVTGYIKDVIKQCEGGSNDYHLVDYLTGVFLEEQYSGQRELAGMISTLEKFNNNHGALGEFLFDKELLSAKV